MRGKIEITCDSSGIRLSVQIKGERQSDKVFLVHALGKALELTSQDYVAMSIIENSGLMDEARPTRVVVDTNELLKQLKEEQNES